MYIIKAIFKNHPDLYRLGDVIDRDTWLTWSEVAGLYERLIEDEWEAQGTEDEGRGVSEDDDGEPWLGESPEDKEVLDYWRDEEARQQEKEGFESEGKELIGLEVSHFEDGITVLNFEF